MKNQNTIFIAIAFALALALAPVTWAKPSPQGGPAVEPAVAAATERGARATPTPRARPTAAARPGSPASLAANEGVSAISEESSEGEQLPVVSIHGTGNILRGKTGSFVLEMKPALLLGGTYVNFKVSGTAAAGVDYVALVSPAYIGQSGYATILVHTLPNARGSFNREAFSVVVTLEPGAGYALGNATSGSTSALIWIKP